MKLDNLLSAIPTPEQLESAQIEKLSQKYNPIIAKITDRLRAGEVRVAQVVQLPETDANEIADLFRQKGWQAEIVVNKDYDQRDGEYVNGFMLTIHK